MKKKSLFFINQLGVYLSANPELISQLSIYRPSGRKSRLQKVTVAFTPLLADCKIEVVAHGISTRVLLDDGYDSLLNRRPLSKRQYCILMALYFFHERVHSEQEIGMLHNVRALRGTGWDGELQVLIYDLQADRLAIRDTLKFLRTIGISTTEVELFDIQSRSLYDFPSGKGHSRNSRKRKSRRLVASRLSYLIRKDGLLTERLNQADQSFLSCFWGMNRKRKGSCFITLHDVLETNVGYAELSSEQMSILDLCSVETQDSERSLKELDRVLLDLIGKLHRGRAWSTHKINEPKRPRRIRRP